MTALILAAVLSQAVPGENCAELLDAGVPAPVVRLEPGTVVEKPLYAMTPARTCYLGQELQTCQAADTSTLTPLLLGGAAGAVLVAVLGGVLMATGHLQAK
jgi:hypothetical protein